MKTVTLHPVFRNILFSPKVWGLKFPSLILSMLTLIAGFFIAGNLGLVAKFLLTVSVSGATFAVLYWKDNRDVVAHHARKNCRIKKVVASYCLSGHFLRLE